MDVLHFFSTDRIVARIVVPKGQTVTEKYYVNHVLPKVFENFKEITKRKTVRHLMLQHDNAAPHKANIVKEYLSENKVKILSHPSYSPDLAPCDFFLFPKIKKELGGRSFSSIENLSRAVQAITIGITNDEYQNSFQEWKRRLKLCIDVNGEYFEGML